MKKLFQKQRGKREPELAPVANRQSPPSLGAAVSWMGSAWIRGSGGAADLSFPAFCGADY